MTLARLIRLPSTLLLRLFRNPYFRDTSINTIGLALAALAPLAAMPLISRLYTPDMFGLYGVFISVTAVVSTIASGKYDVAIVIPDDEVEALDTAAAALAITACTSLIALVLATVFANILKARLGIGGALAWLVAVGVLLSGTFQTLISIGIRGRAFGTNNIARVTSAIATAILMIVAGTMTFGAIGLVVSTMVGQFLGIMVLVFGTWRLHNTRLWAISWPGIRDQILRFSNYPRYAVISDLANSMALRLPVFVFSYAFNSTAVGYLVMFQRIWSGSSIFGKGIGETFRQKAARDYTQSGNFRPLYATTFTVMLAVVAPVGVVMMIWGPSIFALVLGETWRGAGVYAQILAPLVCIQFIASPLGWTVYIVEKLRYNMVWQWGLLIGYALALFLGITLGGELETLMAYSAVGSIMYAIYLVVSYRLASGRSSVVT